MDLDLDLRKVMLLFFIYTIIVAIMICRCFIFLLILLGNPVRVFASPSPPLLSVSELNEESMKLSQFNLVYMLDPWNKNRNENNE